MSYPYDDDNLPPTPPVVWDDTWQEVNQEDTENLRKRLDDEFMRDIDEELAKLENLDINQEPQKKKKPRKKVKPPPPSKEPRGPRPPPPPPPPSSGLLSVFGGIR